MKLSKFGKAFFDSLYNVCHHLAEKKDHYRATLLAHGGLDLKGEKMTEASASACKLLLAYMAERLEKPVVLHDQEWVTRRFKALILGVVECAGDPMASEPSNLLQFFFNGEGFLTFALYNGIFKTGKYAIVVVPDTENPSSDISATKAEAATEDSPETAHLSLEAVLKKMRAETDFSRQVPTEEGACIDFSTRRAPCSDTAGEAAKEESPSKDSKPPRIPLIDIPVAKTPEAESESASQDPGPELSQEEAKFNEQYPCTMDLYSHQFAISNVLRSLLELAPLDRVYEDMLCCIMGSIARSLFPICTYYDIREAFDHAKRYLKSVGRTIDFKHPDPRFWITERDGVSGRWD